jgi:hypothetical protein
VTTWTNTASGLTGVVSDGATITTANSANGGTPFDAVTRTGSATATFDAANECYSLVDSTGDYSRLDWTALWNSDIGVIEVEGYGISGLGGGDSRLIELRSASGLIAKVEIDDMASQPRLYVYASSGGNVANSGANYLPTAAGWRVSVGWEVSTGTLKVRLYTAADGKGSTPLWSADLSAQALGAANCTIAYVGQANATPTGVIKVRNIRVDNTTYAALGAYSPSVAAPVIGTAVAVTGSDFTGQVTSSATPVVLTATQTGGTSVGTITIDGHAAYFPTNTVDTATVKYTFTDSLAQTTDSYVEYPLVAAGPGGGISLWDGASWTT